MTTLYCLPKVLSADQLMEIRSALDAGEFKDGKSTAGFRARRVKSNQQARHDWVKSSGIDQTIVTALKNHTLLKRVAIPKRIKQPLFSRYEAGMKYGAHVDDAIMEKSKNPLRSDLAVTVFLSDQDEYEGGELMIAAPMGELAVKLPAGDAVIYDASTIHRVNQINRGIRLAAVTWIQSYVREADRRAVLTDVDELCLFLHKTDASSKQTDLAYKTYANLLRIWADV